MKDYIQTLKELDQVVKKALQLAEENKRLKEEIDTLQGIARRVFRVTT